jgi:hypothetical protein
MLGVEPIDVN